MDCSAIFSSRMAKRQRVSANRPVLVQAGAAGGQVRSRPDEIVMSHLRQCIEERDWEQARLRALSHPCEAREGPEPSPLALACRYGAPYDCVESLLDAAPEKVRHALDSRGTPLHEAMVCEEAGIDVLAALIRADEALEDRDTPRATLLQDVDGFTPLHLLIRRRFQFHMLQPDDSELVQILEMLVSSCPEAVVVPDRGEYEEPPIVYAIKANIYAPSLGSEDETVSRVERKIYEMVDCMLRHYPQAASQVFTGCRGQYTALHSAVFHGRCTDTIRLVLETEAAHPSDPPPPALLGNTQGEIPLHFCVMRGERPKSVDLIARAAPQAVLKRDASGLTPFHWLWIRFVSSMLALDDGGRGSDTILQFVDPYAPELNRYVEYWSLEQNDFDLDLHLIRRMDPPVDFRRMRHIPSEVQDSDASFQYAARVFDVLDRLRETHSSRITSEGTVWTRQDVITSLFWNKVVSLLEALQVADANSPRGPSILVHTAFASSCCVPAVAWIAASLFPQELRLRDDRGRLPLHYAAARPWCIWDWPRDDGLNEPMAARLIQHESLRTLQTAIDLSGPEAVRVVDHDHRLVLHHSIDTFVKACTCSTRNPAVPSAEMIEVLGRLVDLNPESLLRPDGVSKLFPFLQATAVATELQDHLHPQDVMPLSLTFLLLRQNPTILTRL